MEKSCIICQKLLTGNQTKFCSTRCKSEKHKGNVYPLQKERGNVRKQQFIERLGGECSICGYKKNRSALHFHHLNLSKKSFSLDLRQFSNCKMSLLEKELKKCILVCANCHAEIHNPQYAN